MCRFIYIVAAKSGHLPNTPNALEAEYLLNEEIPQRLTDIYHIDLRENAHVGIFPTLFELAKALGESRAYRNGWFSEECVTCCFLAPKVPQENLSKQPSQGVSTDCEGADCDDAWLRQASGGYDVCI